MLLLQIRHVKTEASVSLKSVCSVGYLKMAVMPMLRLVVKNSSKNCFIFIPMPDEMIIEQHNC